MKGLTAIGIGLRSPKVGSAQRSHCVFGFRLAYAMYFPSRVQLAADFGSSVWSRSFSSPGPFVGFS